MKRFVRASFSESYLSDLPWEDIAEIIENYDDCDSFEEAWNNVIDYIWESDDITGMAAYSSEHDKMLDIIYESDKGEEYLDKYSKPIAEEIWNEMF